MMKGVEPTIYNYGTGVEATIDGEKTYGIGTDGGDTDVLGIVPLLRRKKTTIVAQIDFPYPSDSDGVVRCRTGHSPGRMHTYL